MPSSRRNPDFTSRVLAVVRRIPYGRVATYGEVAALAGRPGAARAVGNIMRTCGRPDVPCHRVIAAGGRLGGYGGSEVLKRQLLMSEGVVIPRQPREKPSAGSGRGPSKAQGRQRKQGAVPSKEATVKTADVDLVERCRAGDVDAFAALYREQAPRLFALTRRMGGSAEEGEDLLQEVFLQAYRKLDSFKGDASIGTWLYRLALNHCLDYVRGRRARMDKVTETLDSETAQEPIARRDTPIARHRSRPRRRTAAGRLPRGVRPSRRRRVRSQGGRPHAGDRRGNLEVAGVQGAHEAARDVGTPCIRMN